MEPKTKEPGLAIRRVPLDALHLDPANARAHGDENLAAIEASLCRFGQAEPLVVQSSSGRVIGGNGRLVAMRKLGWSEADVVELDVDDLTAMALGIALNRTSELAEWDEENLARLLKELRAEEVLDGVGFDQGDIDELLESLGELDVAEIDDPGPEPLPQQPVSRVGDLWLLGNHRLLCADSRDPESYTRLLKAEQVDLVWTDPPYGVAYVGKTEDKLEIENDELGLDDLEEFLRTALGNASDASRPGAVWYVAAPAGPNFLPFAKVLTDLGVWRQTLVWVKDTFVLGRSDFHYRHETLFYGWKPGAAHQPPPSRDQDSVWECARPKASPAHPTTKPIDLVTRSILASTKPGATVLDNFAGSGTVIIAAESASRTARAIEIDPRYVDVAVRRWEAATGNEARLEADDQSFEAVAGRRKNDGNDPR